MVSEFLDSILAIDWSKARGHEDRVIRFIVYISSSILLITIIATDIVDDVLAVSRGNLVSGFLPLFFGIVL